jgi:hypothetical protein
MSQSNHAAGGTSSSGRASARAACSSKVQPWHLDRPAVVYVRQSTAQQVAENRESADRQYGLAHRATQLGWPAERVLVIDEDQGCSGATAEGRRGFQRAPPGVPTPGFLEGSAAGCVTLFTGRIGRIGRTLSAPRPAGTAGFDGGRVDPPTGGTMAGVGRWARRVGVRAGEVIARPIDRHDLGGLETAAFS